MTAKRATILLFAMMSALVFMGAGLYGTDASGSKTAVDGYGISAASH